MAVGVDGGGRAGRHLAWWCTSRAREIVFVSGRAVIAAASSLFQEKEQWICTEEHTRRATKRRCSWSGGLKDEQSEETRVRVGEVGQLFWAPSCLSTLCFPVSRKSSNFGAGAKQSAGTKKGGRQGASCLLAASHWVENVCALISISLVCRLSGCCKDVIKTADGSAQSYRVGVRDHFVYPTTVEVGKSQDKKSARGITRSCNPKLEACGSTIFDPQTRTKTPLV
jgi:hypothetical protein